MKETSKNKASYFIILSLILMIISIFVLNWLMEFLTLKEYSPYYFICIKLPFTALYIFYPILFLFVFLVAMYFYPNRKTGNKKYIGVSSLVLCIALIGTIILSGNVWKFDNNIISYNTLFQKDKIVYTFDDIETATLQVELDSTRLRTTKLVYVLKMMDGKQIKIDAYDSFRTDDGRIIEFDKAIASKRDCIGDFEYFKNADNEFNEYFRSLFCRP